jgi:hypothetical protein
MSGVSAYRLLVEFGRMSNEQSNAKVNKLSRKQKGIHLVSE